MFNPFRRSMLRAILLVLVLLLPGTPYIVSAEEAREGLIRLAALPERRVDGEETQSRVGGAPPDQDEFRTLSQTPPLSGANPPYPRNHVLDADLQTGLGTPPANHDFETANHTVGTPASNHDLEAVAQEVGTPPTNHDFETGDFTGWTTTGNPTIESDPTHGSYAKLAASSAVLTSAAFTVEAAAQVVSLDLYWISATSYSGVKIYVLSGAGYTTEAQVFSNYCYRCGVWQPVDLNVSAWQGESIKLKLTYYAGPVGVDNIRTRELLPDMTLLGGVERVDEAANSYAKLANSGDGIVTPAFTVDSAAQYGAVDAIGLTVSSDQYYVYVLSGMDYSTQTQVLAISAAPDTWTTERFFLGPWVGESIKLKVVRQYRTVGIDNLGLQWVDLPGWTVTDDSSREPDGAGGHYAATNGELTSEAFALPADVQQLSLQYRNGATISTFYVELLRGPTFSEVVDLAGYVSVEEAVDWQELLMGVQAYAGETVKLRVRQWWGRVEVDDVAVSTRLLPGWQIDGTHPIVAGEDANGSYVAPVELDSYLISSEISTGIVDTSGVQQRYYSVTYAFGERTGSIVRVWWYDAATGQNWIVHQDASNEATGVKTKYFWLADFMGTDGYFKVQVPREGKFYAIADNIARQQLNEPFTDQVGYNIDTSTGNFGYQATDVATEGLMPLQFVRYYTGHSDHLGTLGYRWTHSYDTRLIILDNDDAGVVFGSGREVFFDWYTVINDPPSRYVPADPRNHESLVKNGDGTYTLTTTTNLDYHFGADGVLLTISDLNGNTVTLNRDGQGRVTTVTNTAGRTLTLAYDGSGRLASVTDPLNAVVEYGYDANGDLTTVTDVLGEDWTYTYDAHRLISVTAPDSTVVFTNTLDDLNRVTSQATPGNATIQLTCDSPGQGATQVTDAENNTSTYYFDRFQRTTDKVDPFSNVWTTEYDADGNLQKRINPEGEAWTYGYDSDGNRTSETDPLGNPTSYTFNPLRQPLTVTDANGNVWTNVYDSLGNLTSTTDPLNNATTYTYNANGNMTSETDALNGVTSYTYDSAGNRISMTDARNKTWTWTYDAAGRMLTETNPLNETTTYTRNFFGWITEIEDPLGHTYNFTYDIWGNLVTHTDPMGEVTTWGYNAQADVISKTDTLGKVTTYAYDDNHNMTSMTDALNQTTSWTYDETNRLTSTTDPLNQTTTYAYDDADRLVTLTDPMNRTTTYAYDDAGRLTSKTLPSSGVWSYTYDDNGNLLTETNPRNYTTTYAYDDVNRLTSMTDALSGVVSFGYDAVGNRTSLTDPRGKTWTYTYDAVGNILTETDPLSRTITWTYDDAGRRATQTDQRSIQLTYAYDDAGNLTSITAPSETVSYSYDNADRMTSMTDGTGTTTWSYDDRSRVTSVAAPQGTVSYTYDDIGQRASMTLPGNRTVSYGYDDAGNLTSLTDWQSRVVGFTYNAANQRTAITRPNGVSTAYGYDTGGRLNSVVHSDSGGTLQSYSYTLDAMGNRTAVTTGAGTESYVLDALNRITSATYPNTDVVGYTYDAAGNRLTQVVNSVTTHSYTYDNAGQMTSDGALTYTYDAAGNLTSDGTNSYSWDWRGRLASATVGGTTATYSYDGRDARTSETVGGVTTSYLWDRAARLPLLVDDGTNGYLHADGLIAEIDGGGVPTYHLTDALGSVRGLSNLSGTVTGTSDFDVFGDVRAQTGAASIFDFTGEQRDTVTGMTYLRARYYEPGYGRFASEDTVVPGGDGTQGFNRYAYVGNNPCTATDPSGHVSVPIALCLAAVFGTLLRLISAAINVGRTPKADWPTTVALWSAFGAALVAVFVAIVTCLILIFSAVSGADRFNPLGPLPGIDPSGPDIPFPPVPPLPHPDRDPWIPIM